MFQDIRFALRMLSTNRAFAAVAILSLALGIGANTAIFTLIDYVVLRALPARSPEQLMVLARNPEKPSTSFNYPDYRYIRDHNQSYSGVIATGEGYRRSGSIENLDAGDPEWVYVKFLAKRKARR